LLAAGKKVRTLTNRPRGSDAFRDALEVKPLDFGDPAGLVQALRGGAVLYNTYWVRFDYGRASFARAVANTKTLLAAAREAGVRRVVHISVTNPSPDSPFPYFRGKAAGEEAVRTSGLSYAILRPTVIFGAGDILINNIAWLLRKFPVFAVAGPGDYRLQPVFAEDVAELAATVGEQQENFIVDAVGPETYTFDSLVRFIREKVGSKARIVHLPPGLVLFFSKLLGMLTRDVVLTREEVGGLMANLLVSENLPNCATRFSTWLEANASQLGREYASELRRHFD